MDIFALRPNLVQRRRRSSRSLCSPAVGRKFTDRVSSLKALGERTLTPFPAILEICQPTANARSTGSRFAHARKSAGAGMRIPTLSNDVERGIPATIYVRRQSARQHRPGTNSLPAPGCDEWLGGMSIRGVRASAGAPRLGRFGNGERGTSIIQTRWTACDESGRLRAVGHWRTSPPAKAAIPAVGGGKVGPNEPAGGHEDMKTALHTAITAPTGRGCEMKVRAYSTAGERPASSLIDPQTV